MLSLLGFNIKAVLLFFHGTRHNSLDKMLLYQRIQENNRPDGDHRNRHLYCFGGQGYSGRGPGGYTAGTYGVNV